MDTVLAFVGYGIIGVGRHPCRNDAFAYPYTYWQRGGLGNERSCHLLRENLRTYGTNRQTAIIMIKATE